MSDRVRKLQRELSGVMLDSHDPTTLLSQVRGDARASAEARIGIYASMYVARLVEVLGEVYPLTARWLGDEVDDVFTEYVRTHPSRSPSLRAYGDRLADFLEPRGAVASLARLEWERYDVFDAADDALLTRDRLASLPPDAYATLELRAIRASVLYTCDHDAAALFAAEAAVDAEATPTTLLVWRDPPQVFHRVVGAKEAELLQMVQRGTTLGLLCDALATDEPDENTAQEAFAFVGRWLADHLLVDSLPTD
ncbi:MAG: DNA-binding domain-containing protein [Polyangia bacterium]